MNDIIRFLRQLERTKQIRINMKKYSEHITSQIRKTDTTLK